MAFPAYTPPSPSTASKAIAGGDDPALPETPATYKESDLRAAIGASPAQSTSKQLAPGDGHGASAESAAADAADGADETDEPPRRRSPRTFLLAAVAIGSVLGVAVLVLLGYVNSDRYFLACEPDRAVPEQGRGFPPWGERALGGEAWRPLKIAPETRCQPQETDDPLVLERSFLAMVLDQATALLTAREVTRIDDAEVLLKQALLLTRPPEHEAEALAKQRAEHHTDVEHLLGDVAYWRAAAKVRDAAAALGDAAKQFDAALAQHPQHVSDAGAWAAYARRLAQELHAGPAGTPSPGASAGAAANPGAGPAAAAQGAPPSGAVPAASATTGERPAAPPGIALPVEPERASPLPPPSAPPPDAGAPTGGVLL